MSINIQVGSDVMSKITGLSFDELEREEGSIDFQLFQKLNAAFPDADVRASSFYAEGVQVEAYDDNGDPIAVDMEIVNAAIANALKSI